MGSILFDVFSVFYRCDIMQRPKLFNSFISTSFLIAILGVNSLATPTNAYADTTSNDGKQLQDACFTLNSDPTWKELFVNYSNAYSQKDYKKALVYTDALKKICSQSPNLNYAIAMTYKQMGDIDSAKHYIEIATDNLLAFSASPQTARAIWYTRYDLENGDQFIEKNAFDDAMRNLTTENFELKENLTEAYADAKKPYAAIMWTGTGIGIAGLGSLIAGTVLAVQNNDFKVDESYKPCTQGNKDDCANVPLKNSHKIKTGYALIGVGVAATVAGAVMAGIAGYQYKRAIDAERDSTISVTVSPQSVQLGVSF